MGLAEKRAVAAYQGAQFTKWKSEINSVIGFDAEYEVDWDNIAIEGRAEEFANIFDYGYFYPLKKVAELICADSLGKDAFKAKVAKFKMVHDPKGTYINPSLDGKTLVISAQAGYVASENWTVNSITNLKDFIEKSL